MIVVGYNEWATLTVPMLDSVICTNPSREIICVDNGSDMPYPDMAGVKMLRAEKRGSSYASALNLGIASASGDWLVLINNDVIVSKDIVSPIGRLDRKVLYGFYMWHQSPELFQWDYLSSWCYIMHRDVFEKVGKFDEKCAPMGYEDADYSKRVIDNGLSLVELDRDEWGIKHLQENRVMERNVYQRRNKESIRAIRDYVRGKHV
jgi:glycosyltransferase involved in cell wall biosynthesis